MASFGQTHNQLKSSSPKSVNPFAGSLLENEQKTNNLSQHNTQNNENFNPFANALLNNSQSAGADSNPDFFRKQQEEALLAQKKEILRKKLHDRVNPVDSYELFSAKEAKTKEELNQVRKELQLLIADVKDLSLEISIAVDQEIVEPGVDGGSYYHNFFHQLRQLIMLLRQKVSSARSWAAQMQNKSKKKRGLNYKSTKGVQDSLHNERNSGANAAG